MQCYQLNLLELSPPTMASSSPALLESPQQRDEEEKKKEDSDEGRLEFQISNIENSYVQRGSMRLIDDETINSSVYTTLEK